MRHPRFLIALLLAGAAVAGGSEDALGRAVHLLQEGEPAEAEAALHDAPKGTAAYWNLLGAILDAQQRYDEAEAAFLKAAGMAPRSPQVLVNLGNHYVRVGKPSPAREAFSRALVLAPDDANANLQMARLCVEDGNGHAALKYLEHLTAAQSAEPAVRLLCGRALSQAGRPEEARSVLEPLAAAASEPGDLVPLGVAMAGIGEFARAEELFARASGRAPGDVGILHNQGLAAARAGNVAKAEEVFTTLTQMQPSSFDAFYQLALIHYQQGRYEEASVELIEARRLSPHTPEMLRLLGATLTRTAHCKEAAQAISAYLDIHPDEGTARRDRGVAYACSGEYSDALADLEWYVRKHPGDPEGHLDLATALLSTGQAKAIGEFNEALRLAPDSTEARLGRGSLEYREGHPERAVADLEAVAHQWADRPLVLDLLGQVYMSLHRGKEATTVLARAYALAPRERRILVHYGRALSETGRDEESRKVWNELAILSPAPAVSPATGPAENLSRSPAERLARQESDLRKALLRMPDDAGVRSNLGFVLLAEGRREDALAQLQPVLAASSDAEVLAHSGRVLLDLHEYSEARDFLARAWKLAPAPELRLDLALDTLRLDDAAGALRLLDGAPDGERDGDYYSLRGCTLDAMGRLPMAVAAFNEAFRKSPHRADLYHSATLVLLKNGLDEAAINLLEQAAKVVPDDPRLLALQAIALSVVNRDEDAQHELESIAQRWPEWGRPCLIRGILSEIRQWDPAEAVRSIDLAMALGETGADAWFYLAKARLRASPDQPAAALEAARRSVQLDPRQVQAQVLAGRLAELAGDHEQSIQYLQAAIRLDPESVQARFLLGNTYRAMGRRNEADAEFARMQELREAHPQVDEERLARGSLLKAMP